MGGLQGSLRQGLRFAIVNGSRPMPKIRGKAAFVTPERARVREKSSVCKALGRPERWLPSGSRKKLVERPKLAIE
jgi:hypothetical protein